MLPLCTSVTLRRVCFREYWIAARTSRSVPSRETDLMPMPDVAGNRIFLERRAPAWRRRHLDAHVGCVGQEHVVLDDLDVVQSVLAPAIADPLGERTIARRSGDVRLGGEERVRVTRAIGRRQREEAALDRSLELRGIGGEAVDLRRRRRRCRQKISTTEDTEKNHSSWMHVQNY